MDRPEETGLSVRYTVIEAHKGFLTKRIWINEAGELEKQAAASPARGTFHPVQHKGIAKEVLGSLEATLTALKPREAIIAVPLPWPAAPDGKPWRLRLADGEDDENALPRSRETFPAVEGVALGFFDIDVPEKLRPQIGDAGELYEGILLPAWNGFADVAMLIRPSVSSGAKLADAEDPRPTGFHVFFVISDGRRLGEVAKALFDRLALNGHAVVEPSRCGSKLPRALVDVSASKGSERLIFEADPELGPGVEAVERRCVRFAGDVLDAERALAALALTTSEERKVEALWTLAEVEALPACETARQAWVEERAGRIADERQVAVETAREAAREELTAFDAGELWDDFPIRLDDGAIVTVDEILSDPQSFKGKRTFSLDETRPQRGKGFIWPFWCRADPETGRPEGPYLSSFEHGGRFWRLRSKRLEGERGTEAGTWEKPVFRLTGDNYTELAERVEKAIAEAGIKIYSKAGLLVRVVYSEAAGASLVAVDVQMMRQFMDEVASYEKNDGRRKNGDGEKSGRCHPPEGIARLILSRCGYWPFGEVTAIVNAPTLDASGRLIVEDGLDWSSGLLLTSMPEMPEGFAATVPAKEDALKALDLLKSELLSEFAFDGGFTGPSCASFSVALSCLITPLVRKLVPFAPLHGVSAPIAGSGKSYLVSLAAAVATGRDCPFVSASVNAEETEKKLVGALLKGGSFIALDNLSRTLSSDLLCQAVTQEIVEVRRMGGSPLTSVRQRATIFATGNNLSLSEDLTRRSIRCRLDRSEERPELHRYAERPFERVPRDRGRYVAAGLTIVRAYIAAGRPDKRDPIASFEGWSDNVRSALVWLGLADPCRTMDQVREDDPALQQMHAVFAAWPKIGERFTSAQLIERADSGDKQLREALVPVCGDRRSGNLDPKRLGEYLNLKCADKVVTVPSRWPAAGPSALDPVQGHQENLSDTVTITVKLLKRPKNKALAGWFLEAVR